uniref:Uncharacterized protein n=1 Tax=Timema cristinae TaxID=61476 RepID=A0A7R9DK32_TIMCR|nr:unnamed protein product [Timema cristinae]
MANGSEGGKMEFIYVDRLTTELSDSVFGKNDPATGVDLNKTKVLFENSLLAGGDGLATPKPNVSTDFILNESAISPDASNGAKRKRDESPEHYNLVMDEVVEVTVLRFPDKFLNFGSGPLRRLQPYPEDCRKV